MKHNEWKHRNDPLEPAVSTDERRFLPGQGETISAHLVVNYSESQI